MPKAEFYRKQKGKGLCVYCNRPVVPGRVKCLYHLNEQHNWNLKSREKLRQQYRCTGCGKPLHLEMDEGCVKCIECREHIPMFGGFYSYSRMVRSRKIGVEVT